jgi:glycerophosphoryl diester phosphodiesterase
VAIIVAHRAGNDPTTAVGAARAGADYIEADLRLWRRRTVEIRHFKSAGPIPLYWERWRWVRQCGPCLRLRDVMRRGEWKHVGLFLDLKGRDERIADELISHLPIPLPIVVASAHWSLLQGFEIFASVTRAASVRTRLERARFLRRPPNVDVVSINHRLLDQQLVMRLQALGFAVYAWAVEGRALAEELISWNVDGLIGSDTSMLIGAVDSIGSAPTERQPASAQ